MTIILIKKINNHFENYDDIPDPLLENLRSLTLRESSERFKTDALFIT